jgi:hypothetical protein
MMVKEDSMSAITRIKPPVALAIAALAELFKTGIIKDVYFESFVMAIPQEYDQHSYETVIFQECSDPERSPDGVYRVQVVVRAFIDAMGNKVAWKACYARVDMNNQCSFWCKSVWIPGPDIIQWVYQENDPRPWK